MTKPGFEEQRAMQMINIMGNGNPGALSAIMQMVEAKKDDILEYCAKHQIFGTHLYVLWSDICNKDLDYMSYLIVNAKWEEVYEFSHKQDYSGREHFQSIKEEYENINH